MTQELKNAVKDIRKGLPKKGYVAAIQKQIRAKKHTVTNEQIKNVFRFRSVNEIDFLIIIDAAKKVARITVANKQKLVQRVKAA